jgi:hypothetical protein
MTNAGAVRVTGRVVDSFGVAIDDTYVVLSVAATTGAMPYGARLVMTDDAGMFVFPNLPPGEYQVQAVALATPLGVAAREKGERSTERGVPEFGSERVSAFGEVVDVQVQTQPGIEVKGVVTIDGMRINPAAGSQMRILATPARSVSNIGGMTSALLTVEAAVNPDGTFVLRNTAGHRRIRVTGLPAGSFVVRITAGGADVTDEGVDMRRVQATELGIELTMKPPVLNVQVVDPTGRPKTGNVVVFSEDRQLWTLFLSRYVVLRAATNGSLRIDDVPAGNYLIAPLHPADRANWADPAFLERLRPTATPVALVAGETRSVTLVQR